MKPARWFMVLLVIAILLGYATLMHLLLTSGQWPIVTLLLGLAPLGALPLALLAARQVTWALATLGIMVIGSTYQWHHLLNHKEWIYLMQNVSMQCLLAWVFGHTLRPGQEPLISQFARRIHGADYSPVIATYTRRATWAWTLFPLSLGLTSIVLFAVAPLAVWSFYVNFVEMALLGLMFVLEYAARRYCLRDIPHVPFVKGITMFWETRNRAPGKP